MVHMKNVIFFDSLTVFNCIWRLQEEYDKLKALHSQLKAASEEKSLPSLISKFMLKIWFCRLDTLQHRLKYSHIFMWMLGHRFEKISLSELKQWHLEVCDDSEYSNPKLHWAEAAPSSSQMRLVYLAWGLKIASPRAIATFLFFLIT